MHDCTANVPRTVVMTVATSFRIFATFVQFTFIIFSKTDLKLLFIFYFLLSSARRKKQRSIHPIQGLPLYGKDANKKSQKPTIFSMFW